MRFTLRARRRNWWSIVLIEILKGFNSTDLIRAKAELIRIFSEYVPANLSVQNDIKQRLETYIEQRNIEGDLRSKYKGKGGE